MALVFFQLFSGVKCLSTYGTQIAEESMSGELRLLFPSLISFAFFVCALLSSWLMVCFGRRTILLASSSSLTLILLSVFLGFYLREEEHHPLSSAIILVSFLFFAFFHCGCGGPVIWSVLP